MSKRRVRQVEAGCCPKCGYAGLEYPGGQGISKGQEFDGGLRYKCRCAECGWTGWEHYDVEFACFTDGDKVELESAWWAGALVQKECDRIAAGDTG